MQREKIMGLKIFHIQPQGLIYALMKHVNNFALIKLIKMNVGDPLGFYKPCFLSFSDQLLILNNCTEYFMAVNKVL